MKEIIEKELIKHNMTQKELADRLFVTPQAVSKWMNGLSTPSYDNVVAMGKIFGNGFIKQVMKEEIKNKKNNENVPDLKDINTFEKAKLVANKLLENSEIELYSRATYKLLNWLVPAVIGLTYHHLVNKKKDDEEYFYEDIFFYLNEYFEMHKGYQNSLAFEFYLFGMDVFESCDDQKLQNHDYAKESMSYWYNFEKAANMISNDSPVLDEFNIALIQLISDNSDY